MTTALGLYHDWRFCNGCGLPGSCTSKEERQQPQKRGKKLSICRRCKTAAYHNSDCQKLHWTKGGHRYDCQKLAHAIQPLIDIIVCLKKPNRRWWNQLNSQDAIDCNRIWNASAVRWNQYGEYLEAMEGFQRALEPIKKVWEDQLKTALSKEYLASDRKEERVGGEPESLSFSSMSLQNENEAELGKDLSFGITLAQRLLFCAYCEADGNQIQSSRTRLAQCISILSECIRLMSVDGAEMEREIQNTISPLLSDAWMELMLSYEEEKSPEFRRIACHVVHLAIESGRNLTTMPACILCCGWKDPLQRPGYMGRLESGCDRTEDEEQNLRIMKQAFIPPEAHPPWCKALESHWKEIAGELSNLLSPTNNTTAFYSRTATQQNMWIAVGCGDRGSGGDDHRVVSAGGKWTEYVLFGTGAVGNHSDSDAPITKKLLRQHIPDAISLAESGGGEVIFSKLAPRTRIEAHCGPTNLRLTAHLGLVIPDTSCGSECKIRVKDEWHSWEAGKILLFDDSYEHEIRNDTDQVRIVLLMRLWHPSLSIDRRQNELREARRQKEQSVEKRYHPPV